MDRENDSFELGAALKELRNQISEVHSQDDEPPIYLEIESISLELSVVASSKSNASGGVKWYVLSASAGTEVASVATQKVSLKLNAIEKKSGNRAKVADHES